MANMKSNESYSAYEWGVKVNGRTPGVLFPLKGSLTERILEDPTVFFHGVTGNPKQADFVPLSERQKNSGLQSFIGVPMRSNNETTGTLMVHSKLENADDERHIRLLSTIANQISGAISNSRSRIRELDAEESRSAAVRENAVIDETVRIISSTLSIQDVFDQFGTTIKELVDFDRITIATIDHEEQSIAVKYTFGDELPGRKVGDTVALNQSESYAVLKLGLPHFRGNIDSAADARSPVDLEYTELGFRSSAILPLISRGELIGSMALRFRRPDAFGDREQSIINRLAEQIAPAIENRVLYEQSLESEEAQQLLAEENAAVAEIGRIISSSADISEVY